MNFKPWAIRSICPFPDQCRTTVMGSAFFMVMGRGMNLSVNAKFARLTRQIWAQQGSLQRPVCYPFGIPDLPTMSWWQCVSATFRIHVAFLLVMSHPQLQCIKVNVAFRFRFLQCRIFAFLWWTAFLSGNRDLRSCTPLIWPVRCLFLYTLLFPFLSSINK